MAQVVRVVEDPVMLGGLSYKAQVCGRETRHLWEGWIEFVAEGGVDARRTPRETTQPDLDALVYWANGLSMTYLEGALTRTLTRLPTPSTTMPPPRFDGPARSPIEVSEAMEMGRAVLNPFSVAAKSQDLLRSELGALRAWHLRNIIRAYDLADASTNLDALNAPQLIEIIMKAVEPV